MATIKFEPQGVSDPYVYLSMRHKKSIMEPAFSRVEREDVLPDKKGAIWDWLKAKHLVGHWEMSLCQLAATD